MGSKFGKVVNEAEGEELLEPRPSSTPERRINKPKRRFCRPEYLFVLPLTSKLTGINLQQQPLQEAARPQRSHHHQYRVIRHCGEKRSVRSGTRTAAQLNSCCHSRHRRHRGQDRPPMTSLGPKRPLQNYQRRENDLIGIKTDQSEEERTHHVVGHWPAGKLERPGTSRKTDSYT